MSEVREHFAKPALGLETLLDLCCSRGLVVESRVEALMALREIGFYRLSAYMLPFQLADRTANHHRFRPGTTFRQILDRYDFDDRLRHLTFQAASEVEVRFSAVLTDTLSIAHGPHWFLDVCLFEDSTKHAARLEKLNRTLGPGTKKTVAVAHYHERYASPSLPPSWVMLAAVDFGELSMLFTEMKRAERKPVADAFALAPRILASWLQAASGTRNFCAHHQRLWNRTFVSKPAATNDFPEDIPKNASSYYAQACVLHLLARGGRKPALLKEGLRQLLADSGSPPPASMGFPDNWIERPIWK